MRARGRKYAITLRLTSVIVVNVPKLIKDESDPDMMVRCAARTTPFCGHLQHERSHQKRSALGLAAEEHRST